MHASNKTLNCPGAAGGGAAADFRKTLAPPRPGPAPARHPIRHWHRPSGARQRGETVLPSQFATTFDVQLTPLPCLQHLSADQRQSECRRIVGEIQSKAETENKEKGRQPMGVAAILAQDPHSKPASTDRSPAPFVHASDDSTEMEFRAAYRAFVDAFRTGAARLRERARELSDMFPRCAFPPPLPFNAPA